jgi:hypothetical protein
LNGFILFENFWSLDLIYSVEICMLTEIEIGFASWCDCINEPMKLNLNSNRDEIGFASWLKKKKKKSG